MFDLRLFKKLAGIIKNSINIYIFKQVYHENIVHTQSNTNTYHIT